MASRVHDPERLRSVARSGLVDSEREVVFDELTALAAQLLDAPFAFMTAVDHERSFWKSTFGIEDGTRSNSVADSFCQYVVETREPLVVGDARIDPLTCENPSIESMGVQAWAGYPVMLGPHVLGTFCVVDQQPRDWSDEDRAVLQRLARMASREVGLRARLDDAASEAERANQLLDLVRTSLLPPSLPHVPGVDLAAWFQPASDGDMLLGDFYDVFPLGGDRWGLAIGDVCGHGADAARLTSLVRYSLRASAIHHTDPAAVLADVDRILLRDDTDAGRFATAIYLALTAGARASVRLGRAGHSLPLLRRAGGATSEVRDAGGPPLGAVANGEFSAMSFDLEPGDLVVLYTDGVIESRDDSGATLSPSGLMEIVDRLPRAATASDAVQGIAQALRDRSPVLTDDAAVLAVRISG